MTPSRKSNSLTWARDRALGPARAWKDSTGRFSIIWDPEGFHLWDERDRLPDSHHPIGIYPTLEAAKAWARLTLAKEAAVA
jgi:hypothetical protein